jgi:hypothetical protein
MGAWVHGGLCQGPLPFSWWRLVLATYAQLVWSREWDSHSSCENNRACIAQDVPPTRRCQADRTWQRVAQLLICRCKRP